MPARPTLGVDTETIGTDPGTDTAVEVAPAGAGDAPRHRPPIPTPRSPPRPKQRSGAPAAAVPRPLRPHRASGPIHPQAHAEGTPPMSLHNILILHASSRGLDPQENVVARLAAACARLDLATGGLDAVEPLPDREILLGCRLTGHGEPADALEALVAAGRAAGVTLLAGHGAGPLARNFRTLAGTLTPEDPRWACSARLARHLWPDAPGYDLDTLLHRLDLDARLEALHAGDGGWDAACVAVLLGHACRAVAASGRRATPALLRNWTEVVPLRERAPR